MNAKDLMIGDYLDTSFGIGRVVCIDANTISFVNDKNEEFDIEYPEEENWMSGISLTPEILEKNEWKNSAPDVWQKKYGGFVFYWEKVTGRFGMDDFRHLQEQWIMHLRIKHIHQLQHALRLCGIDKEIVL